MVRSLSSSLRWPVAIVIVDTEERVRAFLPELDELVGEGLVILDDCHVIRYVGREGRETNPAAAGRKGKKPS